MSGRLITFEVDRSRTTDQPLPSGTVGSISYRRLIALMVSSGEVKTTERVTHLEMSPTGIRFRVEQI